MPKVTHKRMQVHVLQKQADEEWLVEQAGLQAFLIQPVVEAAKYCQQNLT
ncbi:hypothetical protein ACRRTK_021858 [Alexandromys fortis]